MITSKLTRNIDINISVPQQDVISFAKMIVLLSFVFKISLRNKN